MCEFAFVLLAGGSGSRLGSAIPKQFIRVAGKTILEHSYDCLHHFAPDARIVVTVPADTLDQARELLKGSNAKVITGGSSRQASANAAMQYLEEQPPKYVILHDAARPFLSHQILHDMVEALKRHEAVDVAIKTSDTIIVEHDGFIQSIPKRDHLYRGQTPQGFCYRALMRSYKELGPDRLADFTDDCGIFLACHPMGQVRVVEGSTENIKITDAIDLVLADELFRIRQQHLTPHVNGLSLKGKRTIIFGGSMGIGKALSQVLEESGAQVHVASRRSGCDIADAAQVAACVEEQLRVWGRIDLVVNAAGLLVKGPLTEQDPATVAQQVAVNLLGALNVAQSSYLALKASKGMLLQFSSSSFTRGRAEYSAYSACKAGIVNLTQALADEWKADGIRVNCVVPGRTDTAMRRENFLQEDQRTLLSPYEVALTSAKLLSSTETGVIARV